MRLEEGTQSTEGTGLGDAGANSLDLAFWESVKDSHRREELQVYLEKHPDGHFAGLPRARLASIEKELESGNASALDGRPLNTEEIKGANPDRL
jgi:hypothetical protein